MDSVSLWLSECQKRAMATEADAWLSERSDKLHKEALDLLSDCSDKSKAAFSCDPVGSQVSKSIGDLLSEARCEPSTSKCWKWSASEYISAKNLPTSPAYEAINVMLDYSAYHHEGTKFIVANLLPKLRSLLEICQRQGREEQWLGAAEARCTALADALKREGRHLRQLVLRCCAALEEEIQDELRMIKNAIRHYDREVKSGRIPKLDDVMNVRQKLANYRQEFEEEVLKDPKLKETHLMLKQKGYQHLTKSTGLSSGSSDYIEREYQSLLADPTPWTDSWRERFEVFIEKIWPYRIAEMAFLRNQRPFRVLLQAFTWFLDDLLRLNDVAEEITETLRRLKADADETLWNHEIQTLWKECQTEFQRQTKDLTAALLEEVETSDGDDTTELPFPTLATVDLTSPDNIKNFDRQIRSRTAQWVNDLKDIIVTISLRLKLELRRTYLAKECFFLEQFLEVLSEIELPNSKPTSPKATPSQPPTATPSS